MNNFWKKQLPAFFLTLVMLASLAPAALADCSHTWGNWLIDRPATCGTEGRQVHVCSKCGASEVGVIPKTNVHNFVEISNQNGTLTRRCTVCSEVVSENTGNPPTSNQGRNFTISVGSTSGKYAGTEILTKVSDLFHTLTGYSSFSTIYFSNISGYGKVSHNSAQDTLWNRYTYNELSKYVYFVPSSSGSLTLSYTAEDAYGNQVSGVITLTGTPVTSNSTDIVLRVAPGGEVDLRLTRFEEAYKKLSNDSGSLRYVSFITSGNNYYNFDGMFYSGSRSLSQSDLDRYDFYASNESLGAYALDSLSFRADTRADVGDQLTITVRYHDRYTSYDGTLRIIIDKDGKQEDEVVYRVAPGSSVTFNRSDFNQVYQNLAGTSRTVSYIEFAPNDDYTYFSGDIRASGHAAFSKKTLSEEWFYYSTDRRDSYGIDDLIFQAASGAKGQAGHSLLGLL